MRTKTLLAAAAIVAAGLASSQAQSNVYSLNIVGYVNKVIQPGYNLISNPLSSGTNGIEQVMNVPDASVVLTWNGSSYNYAALDTGVWYDAGLAVTAAPVVPPGKGYFFFNPDVVAFTNTFVGTVVPAPGGTNSLVLNPGYSLVGSVLPVGGSAITAAPVGLPAIDACVILKWNGSSYSYASLDTGIWYDAALAVTAEPSYSVGEGFFFFNPDITATSWVQTLP